LLASYENTTLIESIREGSVELAVIIRAGYSRQGVTFVTPDEYSQQLGYMSRPAGYCIPAHVHNPVPRAVVFTREVLFVRSGRMRVDFYTDAGTYAQSRVLGAGDVILLAAGGHGFQMLEDTEMIEVKQGPYAGEDDKSVIASVDATRVRLGE
jgi:hypothetical protein